MAACASPADFAVLEAHLQAAINQWQPPQQPVVQGTSPPCLPLSPSIAGCVSFLLHISVGNSFELEICVGPLVLLCISVKVAELLQDLNSHLQIM